MGALSLFLAAEAAAQNTRHTIWSGTLTARSIPAWALTGGAGVGCLNSSNAALAALGCDPELGNLSEDDFVLDGEGQSIGQITYQASTPTIRFRLNPGGVHDAFAAAATLHISGGGTALELPLSANTGAWSWDASSGVTGQNWSAGDKISLSITIPDAAPPGRPVGLGVTPGATKLDLDWTAPTGASSYDVHYTSSTTVAPDAEASGSDPSAAWVDASHTGTSPSLSITGLTNDTAYRVRVRAVNSAGLSAWAWGTGTPKATTSGSTDASLSGVAVRDASIESVTLDPAFASTTYAYEADVGAATGTWVQVIATVNESNATIRVNGTTVAHNTWSGNIDLDFGANRIVVEVTAQAGNTRNYTITVNRALPELSWASDAAADAEGGTIQVSIPSPAANDMIGTLAYAAGATHPASLTDDVGSGRSTGFTMSAEEMGHFTSVVEVPLTDDALNEEDETFTITIEAGTGYTVGRYPTFTVTITDNDPPAAPGGFAVAAGDEQLTASWTKPDGPVTGYQARWKETAAPDSTVTDGSGDPSLGWVEGGEVSSSSLSQMITGLTNDTGYDVQVRATDGQTAAGNGYGPWTATQAGTPTTPKYSFRFNRQDGNPGHTLEIDVVLSVPAPAGGLELTLTQLLGEDLPDDLCTGTLADSDDIGANPPTSVTVKAGQDTVTVQYPLADNDERYGRSECFGLQLGTSVTGWSAGDNEVIKVTIAVSQGKIAMGSNAAATAKYRAAVAENVDGGTLSVPVTVDYLPNASTTFTIAVLTGGSATEDTDFSIATKTVTFRPGDATKTQNLAVTITDDALVEDDETIELGIVAAPNNDATFNIGYARNASGRLAQITIQSEDAAPAAVTGLNVAAGNTRLDLTWTAPADTGSAALSGYDVHYTSAPSTGTGAVLDDAPASGSDASAAWVAVTRTGTTATQAITSLTNDTDYRVRVRAVNAVGAGPWEHGTGTPTEKTWRVNPANYAGPENAVIWPRILLSRAAPAGGLTFTATPLFGSDVPSDRCEAYTGAANRAVAADLVSSQVATLTVDAGSTSGEVQFRIAPDLATENDECFAVRFAATQATTDAGWTANPDGKTAAQVLIQDVTALAAPTALSVAAGGTVLSLSWTAPTGTLSGYDVHYTSAPASGTGMVDNHAPASGADPAAAWVAVSRSGTTASQDITGLAGETAYRVRVRALSTTQNNYPGHWAFGTGTTLVTLTAPANLVVTPGDGKLDLSWDGQTGAGNLNYEVYYTSSASVDREAAHIPHGDPADGWVIHSNPITATSYAVTGLTNGTAYRVRVKALRGGESSPYAFGTGTPVSPGPSSNANLSALTATWSSGSGYSSLALGETFAEGTTSYTATAPNAATHVKVRPTVAHTAASVTVDGTAVTSGQESAAIVLGTPGNMIWIQVTAEDGTTKDYSLAVTRRPAVTLEASPNPVPEGSDLTVTATLTAALGADVTIPLSFTTGTSESGDFGAIASITITAGATSGTGTVTTVRDDDQDDETFTVSLGANLPSSVEAGTPSSVEVRIADVPAVSLEAPAEVEEGERVTVTARLSRAIANTVMIPVTTTRGTSESGDHGTLVGILISSGATSGAATISTREDDDIEDETFTVAVRTEALPSPLVAGSPTSVEVRIVDIDTLSITLRSSTPRPSEGSTARLTATLSNPAPEGGVTLQFTADGAGDNPAAPITDYTLDPASEGQNATAPIEIAEGQRTARATLRVVNDTEPEDDEGIRVGIATETVLEEWPEPLDLTIPANDGGGGTTAVAWLDAVPNPVEEGREVEIDVWLSQTLDADATIPLTVTRGTSEEGDHGTLDEVVVSAGSTRGTGTISTERDDDADDETFTVRLGSPLPTGVRAGTPSRIVVEIADLDQPRVGLEVDPDVVPEGDPVTVTAVLTAPLSRAVTIPVATVRGTSESGDHGSLSGIQIRSGDTEGTGRITTRADSDTDDETFSVVLGDNLPDGVSAGFPDSVEVLITDETPTDDAAVSLVAEPLEVPEGESVTVTATLEKALTRTVTIPVTTRRGTSESGDHGSLSSIRIRSGDTEGTGTITTSVDTDTDDETFSVVLRANQPTGVSVGYPDSVEITIADRGGAAPGRVRSLRVTAGDNKLDLTWSPPSSGTVDVYQGEYKERSATEWTAIYESGGNYSDTKATLQGANGTTYDVRIRGSNEYGEGPWATGSGTPTAGSGGSSDLRSLSVRVSATEDGSYRSVSLSPSFRSSVTAYKATAPAGTNYAKFRPTARTTVDLILVAGHEVASGAESPAVAVHHGAPVWIAVLPTGDGPAKEYSVTFTIPAASADAVGRSVTAAVDAALAVVGTLSPEHAAEALLGERSLGDERLEALDRLGNANGRYDVGDLLAWIERCRAGGARCGDAPGTMPPASDAALPGAVGAAAKRPRRRAPGGRGRKRRRWRGLAVLLAAALWSCEGGGIVDLPATADVPEPGTLAVEWTAPAGGPAAAGALVEIDGPHVGDARAAGGLELYAAEPGNGPRRFVLAGAMRNGAVLEFEVPDRRQAGLYSVRVVEVAGEDHRLLDTGGYRAGIASN